MSYDGADPIEALITRPQLCDKIFDCFFLEREFF